MDKEKKSIGRISRIGESSFEMIGECRICAKSYRCSGSNCTGFVKIKERIGG